MADRIDKILGKVGDGPDTILGQVRLNPPSEDETRSLVNQEKWRELLIAYGFKALHWPDFNMAVKCISTPIGNRARGILITGTIGNGKTTLLRALAKHKRASIVTSKQMVELYRSRSDGRYRERLLGIHEYDIGLDSFFIDDIGREPKLNDWGTSLEVVNHIIEDRYDVWLMKGWTFYATTNLTIRQLRERYGDEPVSRLIGMCKLLTFEGPDQRLQGVRDE